MKAINLFAFCQNVTVNIWRTISIASGNMACGKNKYALLLDYVYDKKG